MSQAHINWEELSRTVSIEAGRWRIGANVCQTLVLAANAAATFNLFPQAAALCAGGLGIGYVLLQWQSDQARRTADTIKRRFELRDGLGWTITSKEESDLLANLSPAGRAAAPMTSTGRYFASETPPSPRRLLENLEESSWWSKHLAGTTSALTWLIFGIVLVFAVLLLLIAMSTVSSQSVGANVAKVVTSVIVFMFSAGYFRAAIEHGRFSRDAGHIEDRVCSKLAQTAIPEVEAVTLLYEYQILRAGAPPIPSWIWEWRQQSLNEIWKRRKRRE